MQIVFWAAAALVFYAYIGFPLLLLLLRLVIRRKPRLDPIEPAISLLVAAYNESHVIQAKVRNALDLDYPADKLEIVIADDGSLDGTSDLARDAARGDPRLRVIRYPKNRGKTWVLNDTVPQLLGGIVAFSDASSMIAPDALRLLVRHFSDPRVGAVSGIYEVRKKHETELGVQEGIYWKYETSLRQQEAELHSVLGCHGSLYAIRRALYPFPPPGTINDDFVIPLRILQKGYRCAYEPKAVSYEEAREMVGFGRRVRIMAGNLQQFGDVGIFLRPFQPLPLLFFLSHRIGRLLAAACLPVLLITNLLLWKNPFYAALGCLQLAFYALALLGAAGRLRPKFLRLPYYFSMINVAMFIALYGSLARRRAVTWK